MSVVFFGSRSQLRIDLSRRGEEPLGVQHMSTRHLEMLVWGPGRRKSKKTFSGQPKLPLGRLLRLASPTSVNPAGKIRQDRREKPNMNFLTSVVLGFHTTKTVLKRENDGSQKNLGRQMFENGRGRRCFAGFGSIWLGLVSARLALQTRRRRFFHHYGWRVQPDDSSAH